MLYDWTNKPIEDMKSRAPADGQRLITWEPSDRYATDASRGLSPVRLDSIFNQANAGDPREQFRLAREIEEKDWDTAHALQTRCAAVLGLERSIRPTKALEKDSNARKIADEIFQSLEDEILHQAIGHMLSGLLAGYSGLEIVWDDGGRAVIALEPVDGAFFSFTASKVPLIISTNAAEGRPLAPYKFIFHRHAPRSGDATRGGLIRPLGWMYLFANLGVKDLMRFVEKFGMPFVTAKIDENTWEQERGKVAYLIRNFGSDGGAVFTKAVELEFIDAVSSGGDVYFKLMDYFGAAKTKVILGQTATSGDAGGFSKGQAQENVRKDLLQSDCKAVAATLRRDLLGPMTMFRYGPEAPVPELAFEIEEPEDQEKNSRIVSNLSNAGYEVDPADVETKCGMKIRGMKPAAPAFPLRETPSPGAGRRAAVVAAQAANNKVAETALKTIVADGNLMSAWLGPVAGAIDEALAGLPAAALSEAEQKRFDARLAALLDSMPALFRQMDTRALQEEISRAMFAGDANGRLAAAGGLKR